MQSATPQAIRAAFASGAIEKGSKLWAGHMARIRQELRDGRFSKADMEELTRLKIWVRNTLLIARAETREQLEGLRLGARYHVAAGPAAPRLVKVRF